MPSRQQPGETGMAQPEGPGDHTIRIPANIIETVNGVMRTSRQMLPEIGREPTPEELAEKLAMPLEKVHKVLAIARRPVRLETPIGDENDSGLG
jgi:RNA polymerase primary sigma factor